MPTFEITIQRRIDRKVDGKVVTSWPVVVEWMAPGRALPSRREVDFTLDERQLLPLLLSPREYGILLGRAVFQGGVAGAFYDALRDAGDCLHVLLYVEADEWKGLHWERLAAPFDDDRWTPLASEERTPFAIHLPSVTARRYDTITRDDLRALIVSASPIPRSSGRLAPEGERWGCQAFDAVAMARGVRTALGPIPSEVLTAPHDATCKGPPTLDALCAVISGGP
jgi:hypothetical protein